MSKVSLNQIGSENDVSKVVPNQDSIITWIQKDSNNSPAWFYKDHTGVVKQMTGAAGVKKAGIEILKETPTEYTKNDVGRVFQWGGKDSSLKSGNFYRIEENMKTVLKPNPNKIKVSNCSISPDNGNCDGIYVNDGTGKYVYENDKNVYIKYRNKLDYAGHNGYEIFLGEYCLFESEKPVTAGHDESEKVIDINHLKNSGTFTLIFPGYEEGGYTINFEEVNESAEIISYEPVLFNPNEIKIEKNSLDYNVISNPPLIPSSLSELKNDKNFISVNGGEENQILTKTKSGAEWKTIETDVKKKSIEILNSLPSLFTLSDVGRVFQWGGEDESKFIKGNFYRIEEKTEIILDPNPNEIIVSGIGDVYGTGMNFDGKYINDNSGLYLKSDGSVYLHYVYSTNEAGEEDSGYSFNVVDAEPYGLHSSKPCPGGTKNPIDINHLKNSGKFSINLKKETITPTFTNTTTERQVTSYEPVLFNPNELNMEKYNFVQGVQKNLKLWHGNKEDYSKIQTKDPNTIYFIEETL